MVNVTRTVINKRAKQMRSLVRPPKQKEEEKTSKNDDDDNNNSEDNWAV
jgi:hypothetical protein